MLSFLSTNTFKSFSSGLFSNYFSPSLYLCLTLPQLTCKTLHLPLLNFMGFPETHFSSLSRSLWMLPFPQACQQHSTSWCYWQTCWGCIDPTVHVIDKAVKQCPSQYWPQKNSLIAGLHLDNSLSVTLQPISYPPSDPSIKLMPPQFSEKGVDSVKCFADSPGRWCPNSSLHSKSAT